MWIKPTIIAAGILSVALIPGMVRGMDEEIIEVHGCAPGWTDVGSYCVMDPVDIPPGEGGGTDSGGSEGGGGVAEPMQQPGWDEALWEEMKRQWRCDQCAASQAQCLEDATAAENRCVESSKKLAVWRCDPGMRGDDATVTPWGCTLYDHGTGMCGGVEEAWTGLWKWQYQCKRRGGVSGRVLCEGDAMETCRRAWAANHPGGSTQVVDSGSVSITFEGIGASGSRSVTATYNLSPSIGYLAACNSVGTQLSHGCNAAADSCYNHTTNRCNRSATP